MGCRFIPERISLYLFAPPCPAFSPLHQGRPLPTGGRDRYVFVVLVCFFWHHNLFALTSAKVFFLFLPLQKCLLAREQAHSACRLLLLYFYFCSCLNWFKDCLALFNVVLIVKYCLALFNVVLIVKDCLALSNVVIIVKDCLALSNAVIIVKDCLALSNVVIIVKDCLALSNVVIIVKDCLALFNVVLIDRDC